MAEEKQGTSQKKSFLKTSVRQSRHLTHFIRPMLAKETKGAFDDDEWLFEIKWDGYRAIAEIENGSVKSSYIFPKSM